MPMVDIQLIEGVFDEAEKTEMIERVTEAMLAVEGEAMREVTWVRIWETASGNWAIGGKPLRSAEVRRMKPTARETV